MTIVSVIIPCYNEQDTIHLLLDAIYRQTFPLKDLEVIIADGGSSDQTLENIHLFQASHENFKIQVIENKLRSIPAGLNSALRICQGDFIVRLDAHSEPAQNYIELCIKDLLDNKGQNVGGIWEIKPGGEGWVAKSIATAASHPFAVGDARYRYSKQPGYVDTVPFGSYPRGLFDKIGNFDESLLTNEDYELNTRIRLSGGKIWFNPRIKSIYYARSNYSSLAKQYWRYGFWKFKMLERYPKTLRWRQALPPLFVAGIIILAISGIFIFMALVLLLFIMAIY
jgi:succinoglycan biosynthesis protein ExoA